MKRIIFLSLTLAFICAPAFSQSAVTMYVAVKTTELKTSAGIFSRSTGVLNFGDAVTLLSVNGKWAEVRTQDSLSGWTAMSALTLKRVANSGFSASAREVSLAGKGFNEETEIEYKKSGLDYSFVDIMETINIPGDELREFVEEGKLSAGE